MTDKINLLTNDKDRKVLQKEVDAAIEHLQTIDARKTLLKDIIDTNSEAFGIPKKIIRDIIKTKYTETFKKKTDEAELFEVIYTNTYGKDVMPHAAN